MQRVLGLIRLDSREPDHLAPFLGFVGNELTEIGRRAHKRRAAKFGEPRFDLGIAKARVDLLLSLSTISADVFFGATMPNQGLIS
jgi:hypothetical protein